MEELGFPHKTLERAVTQLRQELNDCRAELEITKRLSPAPGEPTTVKTGKIYLDPGPKVLGKI